MQIRIDIDSVIAPKCSYGIVSGSYGNLFEITVISDDIVTITDLVDITGSTIGAQPWCISKTWCQNILYM